jgi:large subunit ribosomal protein L10
LISQATASKKEAKVENMANLKKKQKAEEINQKLQETKAVITLGLGKITHRQLEEIRKSIKPAAKLMVIKNSLYEKAVNKNLKNNSVFAQVKEKYFPLKEKNAVVFFKEVWDEGIKKIYAFIKKDYQIQFKFGLSENVIYDNEQLAKLAQLPAKEVLIGRLIGQIKSPISRLYQTTINPLQKLIYILQQKSKQS